MWLLTKLSIVDQKMIFGHNFHPWPTFQFWPKFIPSGIFLSKILIFFATFFGQKLVFYPTFLAKICFFIQLFWPKFGFFAIKIHIFQLCQKHARYRLVQRHDTNQQTKTKQTQE